MAVRLKDEEASEQPTSSPGESQQRSLPSTELREQGTGLPSRELLLDRLTQAVERARRHSTFRFAVLAVALDQFRMITDSLGHEAADAALVEAAKRIDSCVRGVDTVTHWNGAEFVVLLENIVDDSDGVRVAERIQRKLAQPMSLSGHDVIGSASVGVVLSSATPTPAARLVQEAAIAMSRARAIGPGTFVMYDSAMHARVLERLQLETDLRRAVERREFEVYYQPQVCLKEGRIREVEALVRWHHPTRGLVAPLDFIPVAEETGLISAIGSVVLDDACRQTAEWQRRFDKGSEGSLGVSVNISLKQTCVPGFVDGVSKTVNQSGVDARSVKLEITESFAMSEPEHTTSVITDLRALGIGVYLDDFGNGFSNLAYLHRLPLDAIKIDRNFITQMHDGPMPMQLVRTVRDLARNIGVTAIAEGVESQAQLSTLRELGCEAAQGYLFSKPVPATQMGELIAGGACW